MPHTARGGVYLLGGGGKEGAVLVEGQTREVTLVGIDGHWRCRLTWLRLAKILQTGQSEERM